MVVVAYLVRVVAFLATGAQIGHVVAIAGFKIKKDRRVVGISRSISFCSVSGSIKKKVRTRRKNIVQCTLCGVR